MIRDDIRAIARMNRRLERLGALQNRWREDQNRVEAAGRKMRQRRKPVDLDRMDLADLMTGAFQYPQNYPLYHHLRVYGTTDGLSAIVAGLAGHQPDSDVALYLRQILRAWRDDGFSAYHAEGRETENAFLSRYDLDFRLRRLIHLRAHIDEALDRRERIQGEKVALHLPPELLAPCVTGSRRNWPIFAALPAPTAARPRPCWPAPRSGGWTGSFRPNTAR